MNVYWTTREGPSANHRTVSEHRGRIAAGLLLLACGKWSPIAGPLLTMTPNRRMVTCRGCQARGALPFAVDGRLMEVGWKLAYLTTGHPRYPPRMHLIEPGAARTCCGVDLPDWDRRGPNWRYERLLSAPACERCFTAARVRRLIEEGMDRYDQ